MYEETRQNHGRACVSLAERATAVIAAPTPRIRVSGPPTETDSPRGSPVFPEPDRDRVWWIVPAGQRLRHAITARPGSRPAGDVVQALCCAEVKLPYETWPASKEPATRHITDLCPACEVEVLDQQQRTDNLVVSIWDS